MFAGAWSAEDIPVVNVPQLARPNQSNFGSHFLVYTCWPFVFYCLWFPKLVLRGTFIPSTWRWMGGHPTEEQINLPLTDLLCSPGYQTVKSFIWKSKHGTKLRLCCRTKTCAAVGFFWQGSASSLLDPNTDESHVTDATKPGKCFKCLWLNIIFNLCIKVRLHSL